MGRRLRLGREPSGLRMASETRHQRQTDELFEYPRLDSQAIIPRSVIAHATRRPTETAQPGLSFRTDDRHAQSCRIWGVAAARVVRKRSQRVGIKRAGAIGADDDLVSLARSRG
jgi:hypothetical protein